MLMGARRWLAAHLPEDTLYTLVRARHNETEWQRRVAAALKNSRARLSPPSPPGYVLVLQGMHEFHARMVRTFDAHEVARETVQQVSAALDARGVPHVLVPTITTNGHRVAVSAEDAGRAVEAIAAMLATPEWAISTVARKGSGFPTRRIARASAATATDFADATSMCVFRFLASATGHRIAGDELGCYVDVWDRVTKPTVERPDGGTFSVGTRVAPLRRDIVVGYLSPTNWDAATASPDHWPHQATRPMLFRVREPIDMVYTWVDGDDPTWRARKADYDSELVEGELNVSATHGSRYASRDELRYSLRSVAMYASWVRKIYIVTDKQVPPWLDTSHPHIEIVDHSQIFSDSNVLPVFNSHAIESQLHHIPELSEHYIYMNDDVFFGRSVEPELFFHGNGMGKFFLSTATLDMDPPSSQDLPVMSAAKRNRALIEERFDATVINKFKHTPHSQLRSVLEEMELKYPEVFASVSRSRFRHPDDLSITSALHHYYAYGMGRSMPGRIRYAYQDIARPDTRRRLTNLIRERDYDVFCLNDHATSPDSLAEQQSILAAFFERYFPVPSPYER